MCQALRELMKEEMEEEIQTAVQTAVKEAETRATDKSRVTDIKNLMKKLGLDAKAAMEALNISVADQSRYMTML